MKAGRPRGTGLCPTCRERPKTPTGYCPVCGRKYQNARSWPYGAMALARKRQFAIVELVDPMVVYTRDDGICQLCNEPVDLTLDRKTHPYGATLDHTAPIHSYTTVQLAHRVCNANKGE
jgi:hypothetical protein